MDSKRKDILDILLENEGNQNLSFEIIKYDGKKEFDSVYNNILSKLAPGLTMGGFSGGIFEFWPYIPNDETDYSDVILEDLCWWEKALEGKRILPSLKSNHGIIYFDDIHDAYLLIRPKQDV